MLRNAAVVQFDSCTFTENYSTETSGVITMLYNQNLMTITNCSFTQNHGIASGVIYSSFSSKIIIQNSTFTKNFGYTVGAFNLEDGGYVVITDSTLDSSFGYSYQLLMITNSKGYISTIQTSNVTYCSTCVNLVSQSDYDYMSTTFITAIETKAALESYDESVDGYHFHVSGASELHMENNGNIIIDNRLIKATDGAI
jgi:hypothetical protein